MSRTSLLFPRIALACIALAAVLPAAAQVPAGAVRIHYHRPDGNYTGWGLYAWNINTTPYTWCQTQVAATGTDSFGVYFDIPVDTSIGNPKGQLGFIINNCADNQLKDPGANQYLQADQYNQGWVISGNATVFTTQPAVGNNPIPPGDVRIHYHRPDGNYAGWAIYAWNVTTANYSWCQTEAQVSGTDSFGVYFDIPVNSATGNPQGQLGFIINNCANNQLKDPGPNQYLQVSQYNEGWVVSAMPTVFISQPAIGANPIPSGDVRIHYHRPDNNYSGWALYTWNASTENNSWCSSEVNITGVDGFGVYFDVTVNPAQSSGDLGFIINNCANAGQKDPGPDQHLNVTQYKEAWVLSGGTTVYTQAPSLPVPSGYARIHYYRPDGNYSGWALYTWNASTENNSWCSSEVQITGTDSFGVYFDVSVDPNQAGGDLGFIINNCANNQEKDPGPDQHLQITRYTQAWVISGDAKVFTTQPTAGEIAGAGLGELKAYWIDLTTVAIPPGNYYAGTTYWLNYCPLGNITVTDSGTLTGGFAIPLTYVSTGFSANEAAHYPQLTGYTVFHLPANTTLRTYDLALSGQLAVSGKGTNGVLTYVNGVQDAGVLDDLYYYAGPLGVVFTTGSVTINVWAPTAQRVKLLLYAHEGDTTASATLPMTRKNGVWTATGPSSWKGEYYLYDIYVYRPDSQQFVDNLVTDPYSADIALNGAKTRITDLNDESTKPAGWDVSTSPVLPALNNFSVYELHVREFSVADTSVPAQYRGTYLAFTDAASNGMTHLRKLAHAGLKAVHIMPSFQIASVNEDKSTWQYPAGNLAADPPDSEEQQAAVAAVQTADGYNFGYDPVHYFAPNGGFAFNPDNRVEEYRQMVLGLHNGGLRVVQDVVFNHTAAFGESNFSVLDEVVPDYYYRLNSNGGIDTASCCYDTASEHKMFEKLMIDNVVQNAIQYKIDGFRFDDMSLHFVSNMQHIRQALSQLTLEKNGVDGSKIYIYGEGWLNPESAAIGVNATQANLYGTGIGTFNDRIRDGIRGGSAADTSTEQTQGFATGLFTDPSAYTTSTLGQSLADQKATLLEEADWIRLSLAGNLRDFTFENSAGQVVKGSEIIYGGQPAGYTATPLEDVNYCSVHDNQPLFDAIQLKSSASDSIATRTRRQVLAMSIVTLGQGIPFFFGADDLLRSKDMDNNSYDSGDWFNQINWTGQSNDWGIGLPIASQNQNQWPIMQPLLADAGLKPGPSELSFSSAAFQTFLGIRSSSNMFHMGSLAEIQSNLHFLNTGPSQIPGVIVMTLEDNGRGYGYYRHIVVVFNATLGSINFQNDALKGLNLGLHPLLAASSDAAMRSSTIDNTTGTVTVAGLTTAVFVAH